MSIEILPDGTPVFKSDTFRLEDSPKSTNDLNEAIEPMKDLNPALGSNNLISRNDKMRLILKEGGMDSQQVDHAMVKLLELF